MSKYIDLAAKFSADRDFTSAATVVAAFGSWLDAHPDQAPGRTITESEVREAWGADAIGAPKMLLRDLGITIVPDPEPTNAELINEAYEIWDRDPQNFTFGDYLDRLGWVKADG